MTLPDYAEFRRQMKEIKPDIGEKEIYSRFVKITWGYTAEQNPLPGYDGRYHTIYGSVCDNGKIYVGKHSLDTPSDNYQGSGSDLEDLKKRGHTFNTVTLEYLRDEESAYRLEKEIVNNRFLSHRDLVINRSVGGKNYCQTDSTLISGNVKKQKDDGGTDGTTREMKTAADLPKFDQIDLPFDEPAKDGTVHQSPCPKIDSSVKQMEIPETKKLSGRRRKMHTSSKYATFAKLQVPVGKSLKWFDDDTVVCTVVDDDCGVVRNGKTTTLSGLTKSIVGKYVGNPLGFWKYGGKTLAEVRTERGI